MQPKIQKEKHKNSFIKQFPAFKGNISSRNNKANKELLYGREEPSSLSLFSLLEGGGLSGAFPWEVFEEWGELREGTPIVIKHPLMAFSSFSSSAFLIGIS